MVAYLLAFLGSAAGIGLQVYLTLYLPNFLDMARVSASLERGLIIGSVFGLGIFLARLITERFSIVRPLSRVFFGTLAGGMLTNAAFLIFHVLFLNTPPRGYLITLGCLFISLAFAIGGLIRPRPVKMLLSSASVFTAIVGTWWLHLNLSASVLNLTPLFRYDQSWTLLQVMLTALAVSLSIGVPANLIRLSIRSESH
jgi:hypothetical protein